MLVGAPIVSAPRPRTLGAWRGCTAPPEWAATTLNSPTLGSVSTPYGARTMECTYASVADDALRYGELDETVSASTWTYLTRVRGLSEGVGFAGLGLGVRFSSGAYCAANLIRNNLNASYVAGVARYTSAGVQAATSNADGTSGDAWSLGRWLRVTWDAAENVGGLGVLTMEVSTDGFNFDPVVARLGNLLALTGGTPVGVGASLAPYQPITAGYTLRMAIESFEQL